MLQSKKLKKEALEACRFRGHTMGRFKTVTKLTIEGVVRRIVAMSQCKVCGCLAGIDTVPAPNGIDIWGDAVALNCKTTEKE